MVTRYCNFCNYYSLLFVPLLSLNRGTAVGWSCGYLDNHELISLSYSVGPAILELGIAIPVSQAMKMTQCGEVKVLLPKLPHGAIEKGTEFRPPLGKR